MSVPIKDAWRCRTQRRTDQLEKFSGLLINDLNSSTVWKPTEANEWLASLDIIIQFGENREDDYENARYELKFKPEKGGEKNGSLEKSAKMTELYQYSGSSGTNTHHGASYQHEISIFIGFVYTNKIKEDPNLSDVLEVIEGKRETCDTMHELEKMIVRSLVFAFPNSVFFPHE